MSVGRVAVQPVLRVGADVQDEDAVAMFIRDFVGQDRRPVEGDVEAEEFRFRGDGEFEVDAQQLDLQECEHLEDQRAADIEDRQRVVVVGHHAAPHFAEVHAAVGDGVVPVEVDVRIDAAGNTGPGYAEVQFGGAHQTEFEEDFRGVDPFVVEVVQVEAVEDDQFVAESAVGVAFVAVGIKAHRVQVQGEAEADLDGDRQRPPDREDLQVLEVHHQRREQVVDHDRVLVQEQHHALARIRDDGQGQAFGQFAVAHGLEEVARLDDGIPGAFVESPAGRRGSVQGVAAQGREKHGDVRQVGQRVIGVEVEYRRVRVEEHQIAQGQRRCRGEVHDVADDIQDVGHGLDEGRIHGAENPGQVKEREGLAGDVGQDGNGVGQRVDDRHEGFDEVDDVLEQRTQERFGDGAGVEGHVVEGDDFDTGSHRVAVQAADQGRSEGPVDEEVRVHGRQTDDGLRDQVQGDGVVAEVKIPVGGGIERAALDRGLGEEEADIGESQPAGIGRRGVRVQDVYGEVDGRARVAAHVDAVRVVDGKRQEAEIAVIGSARQADFQFERDVGAVHIVAAAIDIGHVDIRAFDKVHAKTDVHGPVEIHFHGGVDVKAERVDAEVEIGKNVRFLFRRDGEVPLAIPAADIASHVGGVRYVGEEIAAQRSLQQGCDIARSRVDVVFDAVLEGRVERGAEGLYEEQVRQLVAHERQVDAQHVGGQLVAQAFKVGVQGVDGQEDVVEGVEFDRTREYVGFNFR